jgi:hypothetical protein
MMAIWLAFLVGFALASFLTDQGEGAFIVTLPVFAGAVLTIAYLFIRGLMVVL